MGSKVKRRGKNPSAGELFQRARRSFEKLDYKQAYKDAKVAYQLEPSPEHRRLLERAWLARAQALERAGFAGEARHMTQDLLDFSPNEPDVQQELPQLLLAVGLFDRVVALSKARGVEVDPVLLAMAADRAVTKPAQTADSLPGIREVAADIRAALEDLYRGEEAAALARLKEVPRNSPFADWKLFVRGLGAYYRQDDAEMRANWDRLDPNRSAAGIAAPLFWLADPAGTEQDDRLTKAIRALEKGILGESITASLAPLRTGLAEDQWKGMLRSLRQSRPVLRKAAPDLLGRIDRLLADSIIRRGDARALEALVSQAELPPLDPHWNRARALLAEHPDAFDLDEADERWKQYIRDLLGLAALTAEERALAEGLVWEHLARLHLDESEQSDEDDWEEDEEDWEEDEEDDHRDPTDPTAEEEKTLGWERAQAVAYLREALRVAPQLLSAHRAMAEAYSAAGQDERAAEAYRGLLEQSPDDYDALVWLFGFHAGRDEMFAARDYALRARRLKPTNRQTLEMVWAGHLGAARKHALEKQWDRGREEIAAAEALPSQPFESFHLLVRKAIFESSAGNAEGFRQWMEEAKASVEDPAPVLLLLAIEAIRYGLPFELGGSAEEFEQRWLAAMNRKRLAPSAARMSRIMSAYVGGKVDYPGREKHLDHLMDYLRKCTRLRFAEDQLRTVCVFLHLMYGTFQRRDMLDLLGKFAKVGLKKHPQSPMFSLLAGHAEMEKGPGRAKRALARGHFQRAVDLAKHSGRAEDVSIAEEAQRALTILQGPFGDAGPFGAPPFLGDYEEDDGYDDGWGGGGPSGLPGGIFKMITEMCESMGMDPKDVIRGAAKELPSGMADAILGEMAGNEPPSGKKRKGKR